MRAIALATACIAMGCSATKVYEISATDNGGIPFFPLVPVNKEVRQFEQRWLRIDISVAESVPLPNGKDWKDGTLKLTLFTCPNHSDLNAAAKRIANDLTGLRTVGEVQAKLSVLSGIYCATEPKPWVTMSEIKQGTLVGIQREFDQVPANVPRYVNMWAPYGGSASGDIKLDSRGVLSEASGQVQDQMPAAVASAVGAIGAAAVTALGSVGAAGQLGIQVSPPPKGSQEGPPSSEPVITGVTVSIAATRRVYQLSMTWPWNTSPNNGDNACIILADLDSHEQGCLITSSWQVDATPAPAEARSKGKAK